MTERIKENQLKAVLLIILFVILTLQAFISQAQSFHQKRETSRGSVATFDTRAVRISSDIAGIHQGNPMATGGQIGLIYANNIFRGKIGLLSE